MEQIDEPSAAFAFLRPACVLLTREQTAENARRLGEQLRRVDDGVLQQLQEYVLFPLRFVLKTPGPKKEGLVLAALEGVAAVLSRTCVRSWDVLRELFSELCLCLGSPADPGTPAPSSEEVKVAALRGLSALLHAAYGDVVCRLYEPAMLPGLGAAVSLLLALAERERAREVQSAALKCLQALLRRCDCPEEHTPMGPGEEWALGAAFASFLPGIALALSRVVAGDVRQGHEVTTRAVRVWYRTVGLVMSDDQLTDSHASELPAAQPGRAGELVVRRTAEWAKGTLEKLAVILKRILSWTSAHQHWRVRLEAVSLADHLLSTSRRSLNGCIGPLLDALVTMANDEDPVVRDRCGAALENVARASRERNGQTFADVLSENLHALATSLPRLMRTSDDRRKLAILGAFAGYLRILGPGVEAVLNSAAHLQRVSRALLQVLELDVSDVRVVEERAAPDPMGGGADVRVVEERAAPDPMGGGADVRVVEERAAPDPMGGGADVRVVEERAAPDPMGGGADVRVVEERAAPDPMGGGADVRVVEERAAPDPMGGGADVRVVEERAAPDPMGGGADVRVVEERAAPDPMGGGADVRVVEERAAPDPMGGGADVRVVEERAAPDPMGGGADVRVVEERAAPDPMGGGADVRVVEERAAPDPMGGGADVRVVEERAAPDPMGGGADVRVVEERAAPDPMGGGADVRVVEERAAPDPMGGGADVRVVEERAAPDPMGGGADVRVVEERAAPDPVGGGDGGGAGEVPVRKKKSFVYFTDEKVFSSLQDVCRLLGYYGNLYLLVDHFLDLYRESLAYRKQAAIVLNEIITGAAGIGVDATRELAPVSRDDLKAVVTSVIKEYTSPDNWHLPTSIEDSDQGEQAHFEQSRMLSITNRAEGELNNFPTGRKGSTVHQLNSNIWQICSQLQGMGCMALAVGMGFRPLLMTTLYPVLEKAGDRTLLISQSALASLADISRACGYASLRDLLVENSDYLLSDVALNLQRLGRRPQAPRVLAVMLAHADAGLLPLVRDVLRDVLAALDQSYDERADVFCLVLHAVLKAVVRWFPATGGPPGQGGAQGAEPREAETLDVRRFLLDYLREKRLAEGIVGEEEEAEDTEVPPRLEQNDADADFPDEKAKLPSHIAMTKEVMERCVHLLSHPSLPIRLKVLDVLELCVRVLSSQENELLPLAHRCWPALLRRLTGDDPVAVLRAFPVLCTLGETCGDFLRKRVSKEVLPNLTGSLRRQAPVSARAGPVYTHTLAYKLQAAVLQGLGPLCLRLGLVDSDLESVAEACLPYLSSRQPPKLQEACISVFQHLIRVDPDAMWLTLNELHCPLAYLPPHPALRPVTLTGMGQPRTEYTDNVLKLLQDIR